MGELNLMVKNLEEDLGEKLEGLNFFGAVINNLKYQVFLIKSSRGVVNFVY